MPRSRSLFRLPWRSARALDADLDEELRFHLDARTAELIAGGAAPREARLMAEREFGDIERTRRYCRNLDGQLERKARSRDWLADLWIDLRYSARSLSRSPTFTLTAVLTLALGIGATTAIFSVVNRLLLTPLPYAGGDRINFVWLRQNEMGSFLTTPDGKQFAAWQGRTRTLDGLEALAGGRMILLGRGEPDELSAARVQPSYFGTWGMRPVLGRGFTQDDARPDAPAVVVLSHGLWVDRFGGSRDVIGQVISLDKHPYEIIGVMPAAMDVSLEFNGITKLWTPLSTRYLRDSAVGIQVLGRVKPGMTTQQAERELQNIFVHREGADSTDAKVGVKLMNPNRMSTAVDQFVMLGIAVGLVLLISCANIANLLLARAATRERELAVRAALGAGRGRLLRQLLTESVVIALVAGTIGVTLGSVALRMLRALRPESLSELDAVHINGRVLVVTLVITLLTALLFGLAPALQATRRAVMDALRAGSLAIAAARGGRRLRKALIVAEIALSLVLLSGAGLIINSVIRLQHRDLGFDPANMLSIKLQHGTPGRMGRGEDLAFEQRLISEMRQLPGVSGVSTAAMAPPEFGIMMGGGEMKGDPALAVKAPQLLSFNAVDADYFKLLRIRVLEGRSFSGDDFAKGAGVAIVNATFAKKIWPGIDPIGKRLKLGGDTTWTTVIGIVADVGSAWRKADWGDFQFYIPNRGSANMTLMIRTAGDPLALLPAIKKRIWAVDPDVPIRDVSTVEQSIRAESSQIRFIGSLLSTFAGIALVLAAIGLYGVITYTVGQRTRELGIRMALGAHPSQVRRLVVREGMWMALIGLGIGALSSLALGRFMKNMLFGITAHDPLTLGAVAVTLFLVALVACWLPARRAGRIDPLVAIRAE